MSIASDTPRPAPHPNETASTHGQPATTVDQVLEATSGWHPILNDMDEQYEVFLEIRGDKRTVIVTEDCSINGLIYLTPDGAEQLAAELLVFAAAARSIVIDRAVPA